jgi:amidohydrolase
VTAGLHDEAVALSGDLIRLRRAIHAEPEVGLDLPGTQQKVLVALDGLPLEVSRGRALSSVTAVLRGGRPGPVVLLRADMDALPVAEKSRLDFASATVGVMHACGHDLHIAMLVGAARLLAARRATLSGDVIFMFQPGEEGFGGARHMISEGVLEAAGKRPVAAFALHVTSSVLRRGIVASRPGTILAASDTIEATILGRDGHGSQPHRAADPIPPACEMITSLQTLVTRRFDVFDPVVLSVCSFHSGTTDNAIPAQAKFLATVRSFSPHAREAVRNASLRLIRDVASAHGLEARAEFRDSYPITVNDKAEVWHAFHAVTGLFGPGSYIAAPHPLASSDDFGFVLDQVPGAFLMLGACPAGTDPATAPPNHSADAVFDDGVLADGASLYAELACCRLNRHEATRDAASRAPGP